MTIRTTHPNGVPCWVDLWTSDVPGAQHFYRELFGWEAGDADPAFGGYFCFFRNGEMIAGGMGDMGDPDGDFFMPALNVWKVYLSVDDIDATADAATAAGATLLTECMDVGDLGRQVVLEDPGGAVVALWQAGEHPGFTTLDEPGAPAWFEQHTRNFSQAVPFYRDTIGINVEIVGDTDEFRYATFNGPPDGGQVAGIMDATAWLPEDSPNYWTVYFGTDDVDATTAMVVDLGGSVMQPAEDTPYGRIATVVDPYGAIFRLRTPPSA